MIPHHHWVRSVHRHREPWRARQSQCGGLSTPARIGAALARYRSVGERCLRLAALARVKLIPGDVAPAGCEVGLVLPAVLHDVIHFAAVPARLAVVRVVSFSAASTARRRGMGRDLRRGTLLAAVFAYLAALGFAFLALLAALRVSHGADLHWVVEHPKVLRATAKFKISALTAG